MSCLSIAAADMWLCELCRHVALFRGITLRMEAVELFETFVSISC
jgi:hypothetical protein